MRRAILFVLLIACAALPLIAHALGSRCWIYLPAHVPVLLVGLAYGFRAGAAGGAIVAIVELGWGMMGFMATLPIACELATYGITAGLVADRARTWRELLGALMCAMIAGRVVHVVLAIAVRGAVVAHELDALFLAPWPGIALQLAVLPPLALLCRRARA